MVHVSNVKTQELKLFSHSDKHVNQKLPKIQVDADYYVELQLSSLKNITLWKKDLRKGRQTLIMRHSYSYPPSLHN